MYSFVCLRGNTVLSNLLWPYLIPWAIFDPVRFVSAQDLQKSLSSQGSPIISPTPFGHMTTSSGGDANSPALSQNSAPSSTPNGHPFLPGSGSGSLARQLARPAELDRVSSGYLEPGELLLLTKCCHAALQCLLLLSSFCVQSKAIILSVPLPKSLVSGLLTASQHLHSHSA